MKYIWIAFSLGIIFSTVSLGQNNQYPAHIFILLEKINNKIVLSQDSRHKLGEYFMLKDRQANEVLSFGGNYEKINGFYSIHPDSLKDILKPLEYNDYKLTESANNISFIRKVVKEQSYLQLSNAQVKRLFIHCSFSVPCGNSKYSHYDRFLFSIKSER